MNTILTVIRKELKDTLRDRKTLLSAIVLPALAVPLIILGVTRLQKSLTAKERSRTLKVALFGAPEAVSGLFRDSTIQIVPVANEKAAQDSVAAEKFDAVLSFQPGFTARLDSMQSGGVAFYYKSTNELVKERITQKLDQYRQQVMKDRFARLQLREDILEPVQVKDMDLASQKEQLGLLLGGIIPYMFIIFCFLGCMYPALDLVTGEKEKGTIETLLTVPASRFEILLGKMITISLVGICAALMTIGGMFAAIRLTDDIPAVILQAINDILNLKFILMLFAMLVPLSLFFAGLLSAVAIRASTFKEAQSYATPMTFVVIIPAMIALMPGVKLSWENCWIPVLNIALATKEIIAGTISIPHYAVIVLSLVLLAVAAIAVSHRQFSKEGNILK